MKNSHIGIRLATGFAIVVSLFFVANLLLVGISFKHVIQDVGQIKEKTLPYVLVVDEMDTSRPEVQRFLPTFLPFTTAPATKSPMRPPSSF
ncbi:MAG: hypothetical protein FD173_1523 [Gallionellaceae bacterium]|nr:MAG: hypothetical protein FD173_1523 [Gallionellaceae bacterium]